MRFEFATATRILFGVGTLADSGPLIAEMGQRVLVVTGRDEERAAPLLEILAHQGIESATFSVAREPTVEDIRRGVRHAAGTKCDLLVAFGGGSALDAAKAIAALLTNGGDPLDYVEVIGRGQKLVRPAAPLIAVPTTAGTGSEVTRNAVLTSPEHGVKVSLRSPLLLPRLALVDPTLTYSLPPALTASTGLDALTQLIEPFVSPRANPLTDALCREGIARVGRSLRLACDRGGDASARQDMALASLLGGMALANAGLGAVHGLAAAVGGSFPAPHGAVCARLLPLVMAANIRTLHRRSPENEAMRRYDEVARTLTGDPQSRAADGVDWVRNLVQARAIPALSAYGVKPDDLSGLIEKAAGASSMKGNPVQLSPEELGKILSGAL